MKRIIRFVPLLLLMYVNLYAGHTTGTAPTVLAANFTAPVTTGCAPLAVSFTSTSTINAGDPIVNYNWNFGDGVTLNSANATPSHTYSTAGAFTVTLTVTSQGGSTNTIIKTGFITTFSKPVFSLGPDLTICNATQILLTSVSGYDTYIWNIPGANTFPNYFVTPPVGVNTYWVEVGNGTCTTRDSIVVTVTNSLIGKFGYNVVSSCGNVQVQFTDSSSFCNAAKPTTYIGWLFDGVDYYEGDNVTHTFTTGGAHDVTYLIMNDFGDEVQIDSVITLPNPTPGPSPVNMGPAKNICLGNSVQLDAGNEPGVTYAWTPATGLSSTTIYNPVASPTVNRTYNVTKSKCGVNESGSITVNVNPPLTVDLGPDQSMCPGGSLLLDAGVTGATYQWGSTYNPLAYMGETGQTTFALGAGQYWVRVTKNGCTASDTILITAKPAV
ncbi:MAG TPA: PKD domain-containing protein, partial [Agriterribacter sp.]|nr:PKD domain-containing protein [Agriterribacter sp.]